MARKDVSSGRQVVKRKDPFALRGSHCGKAQPQAISASAILQAVFLSKREILARFLAFVLPILAWPSDARRVSYLPYSEAKPILDALEEVLPGDLRGLTRERRETSWLLWVKTRDAQIRQRLQRGDEDSLVNFLFFGTSYTHAPRLTSERLGWLQESAAANSDVAGAEFRQVLGTRLGDLLAGMSAPGTNERLLFARHVLKREGIDVSTNAGKSKAQAFLLENARRTMREMNGYQQSLAEAAKLNDPTEEFAQRSKVYKDRGLSLDTSLPPNYALERALTAMQKKGLLPPGSLRRVGVIGPGLDFTDKHEGYDFYPVQTVQPFAVMDSLLRLGLARAGELELDTLDLSPRVNEHVRGAKSSASNGRAYTLQIPRDPSWRWSRELVAYWEHFGDQIGVSVTPITTPPFLQSIALRAVRVRPEFVRCLQPLDVNVVLQREEAPQTAKFDLLIATNILVYYDTLEQSLALANIQAMLRPGGYLLTNNLLLELPFSRMKGGDYATVEYSDRESDGDRILWYQRLN